MKTLAASVVVLSVLGLVTLPSSANAQVNGDFNTGDTTPWWTYTPTTGQAITVLPADAFSYDSTPYAHIQDYSDDSLGSVVLGQEIGLSAGTQYEVNLAYRANNWGGSGVAIWYWDSAWTQIGYEWATCYTGDGTDTGWVSFTSPTWTAPAGTANISVRLESWNWSDTYYDDVSVTIVPEPASAALVGLGIGALLISRRRRA